MYKLKKISKFSKIPINFKKLQEIQYQFQSISVSSNYKPIESSQHQ
jgi:hypothetical protein